MPYSTGSDDSGVNFLCVEYSNSYCFDLSAPTSSLTCSEDEHSYHSAIPLPSKPLSRSQRGGKARNKKRKQAAVKQKQLKQRPVSQPNSLSTESTCGSEDSGLLLEEFGYSDVVQVYFYFQQLATALREQQKSFQQMARVMGDIDARWGASGYKNGWKLDPTGSMAPAPSEGFWSYPHPAVYLALMANYIQKYLYFLRRVYPQVGVLSHGSVQNIPRLYFGGGGRGEDLPELFPPPPRNHNQHNRQHQQQRVGGGHKHHGDDMARLMQMMQQQHKVLAQQQLHHQSPPLPQPQFRGGGIHSNNHHQHSTSSGNRTPPPPPANLATWPVPGYPTDGSKSEPTLVVKSPVLQQSSPLKQNYSAVVARNSRSSEGGSTPAVVVIGQKAVSEGGSPMVTTPTTPQPLLYSQKAALSLQQTPRKLRLETKTPVKKEHEENGETSSYLVPSPAAPVSPDHDKIDLPLSPPNAQPSPPPREPVDQSGQFEISKMDVLSEQIWHFHNQVTQKDSTLTKKLSLRDMLYYAISPVFPMCGLYVVGSSLNGFGNDKSDMDLCLMITNKDLDQKTDAVVVLNMISSTLQKMDWVKTQKLILAKVPILRIKFAAPFDDITVDLNANNSVAIKNTHLLCYYSSFDWRVRPLVSIVKEWAKKKGINDANRSSFTSYSLVLMVIHYLQCGVQPPILPSLQHKYPKRFSQRADVRMLSVTQPLIIESEWTYHDKATLGELLIGFLKYFSSKFDYNAQAISVREGKLISRTQVTRSRGHTASQSVTWRSQWRCICIEEPFTLNNTAHSIYDEMVFNAIKLAFEEAHDELDKTRDIHRLLECTPITVAPPVHGATAYVYNGMGGDSPQ